MAPKTATPASTAELTVNELAAPVKAIGEEVACGALLVQQVVSIE